MTSLSDNLLEIDARQRRREEIRGVVRMAVPTVITLCSRMLMDLADFAMISRLPNAPDAQAAILPAQITLWTFIVTGLATVSITNTFVSQSSGRGRLRDASAYTWQSVYLALGYGVFALVLYPLLPHVFAWIGHPPQVQVLEWTYARICLFTVGLTVASEAFSGFFNGLHRPKVTMWAAIEANLINVVISMILIYGLLGFPAMGIAGAAWGTLIGVTYRVVRLGLTFASGHFAAAYGSREMWRLDLAKMRAVIRTGLPQGLQATSDVCVWMVFINVLTGRLFGQTALVASNVAWQYLRISFMPTFGVGIAMTALIGKAIGQRDHALAQRIARIAIGIIVLYMATLSLVYLIFRYQLIALFNSEPEVVAIGGAVMVCAVIWQVFDGIGIGYHNALKGAGDTLWPAVLLIVSHWLIVVAGGYTMAKLFPEWGVLGPWSAAAALIIFLGFALWWRWRSGAWQRVDIFRHEAPDPADAADAEGPAPLVEPEAVC
ncbi:MAG TPA: MATE family efflux transporter [Phycisphaerae bacterium]|nr:MATE family efflux transporter [Phycisphaerae bacterium]